MNKDDLRLCYVNGKIEYFQKMCTTNMATYAIVEFKDGTDIAEVKSIQFFDEIHAGLYTMDQNNVSNVDGERCKIQDILKSADAVSCKALGCESHPIKNGNILAYTIPSGYHVEVDFNKMAQALYNAGYRKVSER